MPNPIKTIQKENERLYHELNKENRAVLTDMVVYLRSSKLHSYDIEVIRKELYGMAREAELRNEKFGDTVGEDYKQFCDQLMEDGRNMTAYDKLLENSHILLGGTLFLLLLEVLTGPAIKGIVKSRSFIMPVSLGFVLSTLGAIIAAYALYSYFTRHSFELAPGRPSRRRVLAVAVFFIIFVLLTLCKYLLGGIVLASINCLIPIGSVVIVYAMVLALERRRLTVLASRQTAA